ATGSGTFGWPVHIMGTNLNSIKIKKCIVDFTGTSVLTSTSDAYSAIVVNGSATNVLTGGKVDSLEIDSNTIKYGAYGIAVYGVTGSYGLHNRISNNVIDSSANTAIYTYYQTGSVIAYNTINLKRIPTSNGEGINVFNVNSVAPYRTII